jgi:ATP-dependent helicase/DNAse subunit B
LINEDAGWSEILSGFDLAEISLNLNDKRESLFDYFSSKSTSHSLTNYSASRLQTYIDCPQRYWLNYILKQSKRVVLNHVLSAMELGLIEHRIIENYLNNHENYDLKIHDELINNEIKETSKNFESKISLSHYIIEIRAFTQNVIKDLILFKSNFNLKLSFEKNISNSINNAIGSIDCFGESEDLNCLLDFKRGGTSIPSQKGFFEYEKIQLWFYLNQIKLNYPDFLKKDFIIGYINLGEPEKSLVFASNDTLKDHLKGQGISFLSKIVVLKDDFDDLFEEYLVYENKIIQNINQDKEFIANPQSESVCNFCDLKNMCTR